MEMDLMESAIPKHLQCRRSQPCRTPDDHAPFLPSFAARFDPGVTRVAIGYFGVQYHGERSPSATASVNSLVRAFAADDGPSSFDQAEFLDPQGYQNTMCIAYWTDVDEHDRWMRTWGDRWVSGDHDGDGNGYYLEITRPPSDRFETLSSAADYREGVGATAVGSSGPIIEHAYWGSARDRIPAGQTDALRSEGRLSVTHHNGCEQVIGFENMCVIRSGQDWTQSDAAETSTYVQHVEPALRSGMEFLAGEGGKGIGCLTNRYASVVDGTGSPTAKTFGVSWWRDLSDLERWAEAHPSHLEILGAAMKLADNPEGRVDLKLYHEIAVVAADDQRFEYRNCHADTGLLGAVSGVSRG
jgi:aldoxime dehydratase